MLNYIVWDVSPQFVQLGSFEIRWYGLLFAAGFFSAYYILKYVFRTEGLKADLLDSLTMYAFFGVLLGARLGHCLFYEPEYYLSNPLRILKVWEGGLASHGAAIGISVALWLFSRKSKLSFLWIMGRAAIVVPLAGAFVRMGNLMNSEIFGHPTDLPWAFIFVHEDPLPRHPTQIYEALAYLSIFITLFIIYQKKKQESNNNLIFGLFLILLFTARFLIEFLKEVQVGFEQNMTLDMGQLLSIPFILFGAFLFFKGIRAQSRNSENI